jgi:hypothetical protein
MGERQQNSKPIRQLVHPLLRKPLRFFEAASKRMRENGNNFKNQPALLGRGVIEDSQASVVT